MYAPATSTKAMAPFLVSSSFSEEVFFSSSSFLEEALFASFSTSGCEVEEEEP